MADRQGGVDCRVGRDSGHLALRRRARTFPGGISASCCEHSEHDAGDRQRARLSRRRYRHGSFCRRGWQAGCTGCPGTRRGCRPCRARALQGIGYHGGVSGPRSSWLVSDQASVLSSALDEVLKCGGDSLSRPHARGGIMSFRLLFVAVGLLAALLSSPAAKAQDYPTHVVKIMVPYPVGGATDITARLVSEKLTQKWGVGVIVENKPGVNGVIGTEAVANAPPDGYTIGFVASSHVVNPA